MHLKSTCPLLVVIILVGGCEIAHAQLRAPVIDVNNEFGIAAQGFMQSYSETVMSRTFDSENGTVPGFEVKASTMQNGFGIDNIYAGIRYQFDQGNVAYNGANLFTRAPLQGTTNYSVSDLGIELGKGFLLSENVLITPFVQGGWRDWRRALSAAQVEDYTHYYVGGGVRGDLGITPRMVLTGRLGIAETFDPSMTATASPGLGLPPRMTFALGSAPLFQAGVGADYRFYQQIHLYGGVDYSHFSYGSSAINSLGFNEPSSTSDEVVFRLGLAYQFL
ncbi:MAG TPA: hypothetical protein VIJ42_00330 [Stellaceae bacterium]